MRRLALPLALFALSAAPATSAKLPPSVGGSAAATSGRYVSFQVESFPADTGLGVTLSPADSSPGNCCGISIANTWKTNSHGTATLRFRWPNHYLSCAGSKSCTATRWTENSTAIVTVVTRPPKFVTATTTIYVRR